MQVNVGAVRHLVFAQIGDDQLLPAQFVRALDARRQHRVTLRGVAADDDHQCRLLDVGDRARIAAVAHGSEEAGGRRSLAIPRAVIHVVGADDRPRQLLHQIAFFVRALRRRDERQCVRPVLRLDLAEAPRHQIQCLIPARLAETVALANQRLGQPVRTVHIVPSELALDACGNAVRRAVRGFHFQNVAIPRPDIEAASHAAIGAHRLGALDARLAHLRFHFRKLS